MTTDRDCKHGQLARSCNVCELEAEVAQQAAEIERLTTCLKKANAQAEHFEREWYLRGDALDESEALLRQASELFARQHTLSGVWAMSEAKDLDAAIKQHLGEV